MPPSQAQRTQALLMLLVANLFWGLSFPVIKAVVLVHEQLLPGSGNWFITAMTLAPRFVLALAILAVLQGRGLFDVTAREGRQGLALGLFASAGMIFQIDGLQFTAASTSAFLTQFYAILIPVYVALRGRHNPGSRIWLACALVLAGVAILGRFDWRTLQFGRGEWETLLGSVFFMGQILWLERADFSGNRPGKITLVMFATEAVVFTGLVLVTAPSLAAIVCCTHEQRSPTARGAWGCVGLRSRASGHPTPTCVARPPRSGLRSGGHPRASAARSPTLGSCGGLCRCALEFAGAAGT